MKELLARRELFSIPEQTIACPEGAVYTPEGAFLVPNSETDI
jgi:hypothetical protein